jgi:hypothetical protein
LLLSLALLVGLAIAVLAMPTTPFPRTLVPYLPIWYFAIGGLAAGLLGCFPRRAVAVVGVALLCACGVVLSSANQLSSCRHEQGSGGASDYDLCHQYFRDEYHPERVIELWASIGKPEVPIATDFEGYYSLRAVGSRATVFEYRFPPRTDGPVPLVVAHDAAKMQQMVATLGLQDRAYRQVADTGYFKLYAPAR